MGLRHPEDWRCVVHLALTYAVFALALEHSLLWMPLGVFFALHLVSVEHNHAHRATFLWRFANGLFDQLLFLVCGVPLFSWRLLHVRSHHVAPWTDADHSSPFRFADAQGPRDPISYRYYQLTYLPLFFADGMSTILRSRNPRALRGLALSLAIFGFVHLGLAAHYGVLRWAVCFLPAFAISGMGLGAVNYFQHWRTHEGGERHAGWTFTCRLHNFLNYNAGYHHLHHLHPGIHWAELPAAHRAAADERIPELVEVELFPAYRRPKERDRWLADHGLGNEPKPKSKLVR